MRDGCAGSFEPTGGLFDASLMGFGANTARVQAAFLGHLAAYVL